jgi:transcriptional regulator with XRE-family HTH domain
MITEDRSLIGALDGYETPETKAWEHTLDITLAITDEMMRQGLSKSELARRMGISRSHLSQLLNADSNITIKTLAKFECALAVDLISIRPKESAAGVEFAQATNGLQKAIASALADTSAVTFSQADVAGAVFNFNAKGKGEKRVLSLAA